MFLRSEPKLATDSSAQPGHCATVIRSRQFAEICHEIRTPLGAVQALSMLALDQCDAPALRDYLGAIRCATTDLLELLNSALDCSRLAAGSVQLQEQPFDLPELVQDIHTLFCGSAQANGLYFVCNARITLGATPVGDRLRIKQVLVNLLSNALKFTPSGSVCLDVSLDLRETDRATLTCQVRDTGMGMARDAQPGLGLTICQDLSQMMGSALAYEGQPGQGSQFGFAVDLAAQPTQPDKLLAPKRRLRQLGPGSLATLISNAAQPLKGLRVLVADDSPLQQRITQEFLSLSGMQTTLARNGVQVLQRLQEARFDALLLDAHMPDMDGVELARRVAAIAPTLPTIVLTADTSPQLRQAYAALTVAAVLTKPADPLALLAVLAGKAHAPTGTSDPHAQPSTWKLDNLRLQLGYNEDTVQSLLGVFRRQALQNYHRMLDLIRAGQLDAAAGVAHTISGAAGNMGAAALHTAAVELVRSLRTGRLETSALDRFEQAFEQPFASMPLAPCQPDALTSTDKEALQQDLHELDQAPSEQYFISSKTLDKVRKNLNPNLYPMFDLFCEYAQDLQYPQAQQTLKALRP
jgi:two-component system sensor histidine kinase/response regulator FitF